MNGNYNNPRYGSSTALWCAYRLPEGDNSFRLVANSLQVEETSFSWLCLHIAVLRLRGVGSSEQDREVGIWLEQSGISCAPFDEDATFYNILIQNVDILADVLSGVLAKTLNLSAYEWIAADRVIVEYDSLLIGLSVIESLV